MSYGACDDVTSEMQRTAYEMAMKSAQNSRTCLHCGIHINSGDYCTNCRHSVGSPWICVYCKKRLPDIESKCDCEAARQHKNAGDAVKTPPTSILTEAASLISGERRDAYGTVNESFARVARTWTDILKHNVTPQQVALCMIALKLHREAHASKRDNRVDICGYTALLDQLYEK